MATAPTYSIRIKDPTTENSKNVKGTITFALSGPQKIATGNLAGFPDGGTITITGERSFTATFEILAKEMMQILEAEMVFVYKVGVTLEIYDPTEAEEETAVEETPVEDEPVVEETPVEPEIPEASEIKAPEQPLNVFTPKNTTIPKKTTEKKGTVYGIKTVFEKTIELDELSIPGKEGASSNQDPATVVSMEFPLVKINEYIFARDEIRSITIDCTEFLPKITLSIGLISQLFIAKEMPKDGDIISIAIRSRNDLLKIIRNDYVITGVHSMPNSTETKSPVFMTFYGELFIPGLKSQKNDFSFEGTTYDALMSFAKTFGLGFASNDDNTDDKQIWLKANIAGDIYVNNLTERAWRDQESFYQCWIDIYYNLNFVNINKQLISAETEVDIAALISNIDSNTFYKPDTDESKVMPTVKVFSNFQTFRTTPFYIMTWRPMNRSSAITFQIGTKMTCEMFEHNHNLYENPESTKYWGVEIEPTYDKDKTNKTILLRGRATYVDSSINTELKRANYSYTELYEKYPWLGVQYTISNPDDDNLQWDGNHHKNYQVAKVKNLINNKELDKLNLHLVVEGNNFNIIRGDKIPVALIRTNSVDNMKINPESKFNDSLDLFYSGWYLVKGFTLSWNSRNEGSITSSFAQEFILTRREWPTPIPVDPIITTENI